MSFDLDRKEFDDAINNSDFDFIWQAYKTLREELDIQRDLIGEVMELEKENFQYKEELARVKRLPHIDKARASAIIMQVAAQLARMSETKKAKHLQEAVEQWGTYTVKIEAERDRFKNLLEDLADEYIAQNFPSDDEDFELLRKISAALGKDNDK